MVKNKKNQEINKENKKTQFPLICLFMEQPSQTNKCDHFKMFFKGSACEAPLSPQCFRKNADDSVYRCEWSMNTTESDVTFILNFK